MAILYLEDPIKYNNDLDIGTDNLNWTWNNAAGEIRSSDGRFGGKTIRYSTEGSFLVIPWAAITADLKVIVNMTFRTDVNGGATDIMAKEPLIRMTTGVASEYHFNVGYTGGGIIYASGAGDTFYTGSLQNAHRVRSGVWHTLEAEVLVNNGAGTLHVKLDGVTVMNLSALDTRQGASGALTSLRLGGTENFCDIDHYLIMDGSGSFFNTFVGDIRKESQLPDADGSVLQWTPSASTAVSCIDDAFGAYDDDGTYISETTTDEDNFASHAAFALTNLSSIEFVSVQALARTDGTDSLALLAKSVATTSASATLSLSTAYQWKQYHERLDPNTAAVWADAAAINAAEFGVRRKA